MDNFFDISGIFDNFFNEVNEFSGPYISCHILSLLEYIFIKGDNLGMGQVEIKWLNHNEIEAIPIDKKFFLLNDNNNPIIIPIINVNRIIIFIELGIIINCSGFNIQVIIIPEIIVVVDIIMIGILE